jgi:hypothetical protein
MRTSRFCRSRWAQPKPSYRSPNRPQITPRESAICSVRTSCAPGPSTHDGRPLAARVMDVACRTLDSFETAIPKVRLLVIDAEGSEFSILRGAARRISTDRPAIVVEAAPAHLERDGADPRQLYDELLKHRYRVFEIGLLRIDEVSRVDRTSSITNWLCLPTEDVSVIRDVRREVVRAAFLPLVMNLNPLRRPTPRL